MKAYDPPQHKAPKCKVNLTPRLAHTVLTAHTAHEVGNESSRSSLYSIPSIEWDGRCKSDFGMRSKSLPRYKPNKLFRTQSHSGFINSYMKDPEPMHYHLPRCRSCGATNVSYAFERELTKREKAKKIKTHNSIYFSVDNIPQKCSEEADSDATYVKVQEKFVPVFKVEKKETEFVESQEFNEDNYIGDIGNSFSSDNQTIIEKTDGIDQTDVLTDKSTQISKKPTVQEHIGVCTADLVAADSLDDVNKTLDSIEGEYHSFTDLEDSYESPVKELVEKDIRDYSVPIDFYCEDFKIRDDAKKSPLKIKNILEPILEESKSSYGDDSNLSQNEKKEELVEGIVGDVVNTAVLASQLKLEIATNAGHKVTTESLVVECSRLESYSVNEEGSDITANDVESFTTNNLLTAIDVYENATSEQDMVDMVYDNVFDILSSGNESDTNTVKRQNSLASILSSTERNSFDSTAEFEKYEVVSEVLSAIINRIDFVDLVVNPKVAPNIEIIEQDFVTDDVTETFSIAKIIEDIEQNVCLNETVLTEVSETDISLANKVIESILYYIFDRAMFINHQKEKGSKKTVKRVVTVADFEDILFTAQPIWREAGDYNDFVPVEEEHSEERDFYAIKDFFNAKCLENVADKNTSILRVNIECKSANKVRDSKEIETIYSAVVSNASSSEIKDSDEDHIQQEFNSQEVKTGNIHFLVNNIENHEKTHRKEIDVHQEFVPNAIEKLADELISSKIANCNITEEFPITNDNTEHFLNETYVESSDMNNAFCEDFSQVEDPTISSHTEDNFATLDIDLTAELKENISLEPESIIKENISNISQEEFHSSANDEFKDISDRTEEFASFSTQSNVTNIEEYLSPIKEFPSPNDEPAFSPKYRDISQKNLAEVGERHDPSRKRKHMSVKEAQSRSSSPNRKTTKKFELTESPIKSGNRKMSDMDSPFMRKANVLAMSQTEHSGGVKYWLSFDEHLPVDHDKHVVVRSAKSIDDTLPSFISIDIDENIESKSNEFYEIETKQSTKRTSVLMNEYTEKEVNIPAPSASSIEYDLVDDPDLVQSDPNVPQKRLLYELHSRPTQRKYSSWPPFEDTLFYRIISKFRMSESFDPNDLEDPNFDSSSYDTK